jgi:HK97 family phage prohead protease
MTTATTEPTAELLPARPIDPMARRYRLDDLHIRSEGSGRVVEAYAAVFGVEAKVHDEDGRYRELLTPTSFGKTLQERGTDFMVIYNHGRDLYGKPAAEFALPIGVPLEVTADERGLFTATQYLDNPLADTVLDAIKQRAVRFQSFTGQFVKSIRSWPGGRQRGGIPLITRHEIDLREYGPTMMAYYGGSQGAAILGTRAQQFVDELLATPRDERLSFLERFEFGGGLTTPLDAVGRGADEPEAVTSSTPDEPEPLAADEPASAADHSAQRSHKIPLRTRLRIAQMTRVGTESSSESRGPAT